MGNDSVKKTLVVSVILCIFFSVIVSTAAVKLRPLQIKNRELDVKKNILSAAGIVVSGEEAIENAFTAITKMYIELPSGNIKKTEELTKDDLKEKIKIEPSEDIAGLVSRDKYIAVYILRKDGAVSKIILPIISKGLWSTMFAFMALDGDANTISGLEYYMQGETPGLGAEVTNPRWKKKWGGKKVYKDNIVTINVPKAGNAKDKDYDVDGISGATITSVGVANSLKYWLGEKGFQSFLTTIRGEQ